jgi:hypothetical protein
MTTKDFTAACPGAQQNGSSLTETLAEYGLLLLIRDRVQLSRQALEKNVFVEGI